jgi:hypothetical protein
MPNLGTLLSETVKIVKVADPTADGTSAVRSTALDMHQAPGFQGVLFITSLGTAATGNTIHAEQSDDDAATDAYNALAGTEVSSGTSDEDLWIDIVRPRKRYVEVVITRGTSTTVGDIWAILYHPGEEPVDNTTTGTIAGAAFASPAEGTA